MISVCSYASYHARGMRASCMSYQCYMICESDMARSPRRIRLHQLKHSFLQMMQCLCGGNLIYTHIARRNTHTY